MELCINFLKIDGCSLEEESVKILAKCKWENFKKLSLSSNDISDVSLDYLSYSSFFRLNKIVLCKNSVILDYYPITNLGVSVLAKSKC